MSQRRLTGTSVLVALLLFSMLAAVTLPREVHSAAPIIPSGILYYVPITFTNSQSSPTPAPFQVLLQVNSQAYSNYEASNLRNIEFFNSSGFIVPSWLESGDSGGSSNTIYWLKLGAGIPASSSVTVFMGFADSSSVTFNNQVTGEAPQLSGTYAQYDTGSVVFPYYAPFGGQSGGNLPFGWQTDNVGYVSVKDHSTYSRLTFTSTSSSGTGAHVFAVSTPSVVTEYPTVLESFMSIESYGTGGNYEVFGDLGSRGSQTMTAAIGYGKTCSGGVSGGNFYFMTGNVACLATYQAPDNGNHVFSLALASSAILNSALIDYTAVTGSVGITSQPTHEFGFGGGASAEGSGALNVFWARARAYPPGGVMPHAQFGSLIPVPAESVSVSCATSPIAVDAQVACNAEVTGNSPTGIISWSTSGSGSFSSTTCTVSSGACGTLYTPTNAVSPVTITARYGGDSNNQPMSGTFSLSVLKLNSSVTVACSSQPVTIGVPTPCNAKVAGLSPTGFVTFSSSSGGEFQPATCTLTSGTCESNFTPSSVGIVPITALYDGDSNNERSLGTTSIVVVRAPTSTDLICVPSSVQVGSSTSCLATVRGGYSPTGIVVFSSSSTSGTFTPANNCTLVTGTCQVSYFDSTPGSPMITATYEGDSNNGGSEGAAYPSIGLTASTSSTATSSTTSSTTGSGAPIPEFPIQIIIVVLFVIAVVAAYVVIRRGSGLRPANLQSQV